LSRVFMKNKVLLVRSRTTTVQNSRLPVSLNKEMGYIMPLGIAYIASFLRKKGVVVSVIDADAEGLELVEVEERLSRFKPDVVGVTSYTQDVYKATDILNRVKKFNKDILSKRI